MSHTPNTFLAPIIIFNILYIQIKNPEKRRKKQENNQDIGLNYVCVCVWCLQTACNLKFCDPQLDIK